MPKCTLARIHQSPFTDPSLCAVVFSHTSVDTKEWSSFPIRPFALVSSVVDLRCAKSLFAFCCCFFYLFTFGGGAAPIPDISGMGRRQLADSEIQTKKLVFNVFTSILIIASNRITKGLQFWYQSGVLPLQWVVVYRSPRSATIEADSWFTVARIQHCFVMAELS